MICAGLGFCEELVHDLGACGDDRSQFAAVDDLGGAGGGVSDEASDLLDADPAVAQQADEGGPQLARRPASPPPLPGSSVPPEAAEGRAQPVTCAGVPGQEPGAGRLSLARPRLARVDRGFNPAGRSTRA
jgi:hypothetical protein